MAPNAPPELLESTAKALQEKGFGMGWQVAHAPMEVMKTILSPTEAPREPALVACAQQRQRAAEQASRKGVSIQTLKHVARSQEAQTKAQRPLGKSARSACSSSDGSRGRCDGEFDATSCLGRYGVPSVDRGHMNDREAMKSTIRAARRAASSDPNKIRYFLCRGPLEKWAPSG